jgi:predicted enzyme related to lactoylglutathione lyase
MISHVPVRRLFESHLTVSDLQRSVNFYRDLVGLTLALEVPERNAAFFGSAKLATHYSDCGRSVRLR